MIVGLCQMDMSWENQIKNINKCEAYIKEASERNVELILFPEMALTGFTMNLDSLIFNEEEILEWLRKQAKKYKINIGLGYATKKKDKGENKYAMVSSRGDILVNYKKIHPFSFAGEKEKYAKGESIESCTINGITLTPFICYDLRFPEIFQIASRSSKLIIVAANWPKSREEHWETLLKARAIENQCFIAGINRFGNGDGIEYNGSSMVIDPSGKVINRKNNKEKLIIENLDFNKVTEIREKFDLKDDRREELYIEKFKKILTS